MYFNHDIVPYLKFFGALYISLVLNEIFFSFSFLIKIYKGCYTMFTKNKAFYYIFNLKCLFPLNSFVDVLIHVLMDLIDSYSAFPDTQSASQWIHYSFIPHTY